MAEGRSTVAFGLLLQDEERATARQRNKRKKRGKRMMGMGPDARRSQTDGDSSCRFAGWIGGRCLHLAQLSRERLQKRAHASVGRPSWSPAKPALVLLRRAKLHRGTILTGAVMCVIRSLCLVSMRANLVKFSYETRSESIWAAHVYVYSSSPHPSGVCGPCMYRQSFF